MPGAPEVPPTVAEIDAPWQREFVPDPVALFRYSALTFNGHRIHYDRPYAMEVEHYPGLVVHGPLIATLLLFWFGSGPVRGFAITMALGIVISMFTAVSVVKVMSMSLFFLLTCLSWGPWEPQRERQKRAARSR